MLEYQGFYASVEYIEERDLYIGLVFDHPIIFGAIPSHGESICCEFVKAVEEYVAYHERRRLPIHRWDRLRKVS